MMCRQALSVYRDHSWRFIEEHIHDTLGRSYRELADLAAAVHHFMAILPCPQATTALQGRYLHQFLAAVHQAGAAQVCKLRKRKEKKEKKRQLGQTYWGVQG